MRNSYSFGLIQLKKLALELGGPGSGECRAVIGDW